MTIVEGTGAGRRVALVVGNSGYTHVAALPNPQNDASDIAGALRLLNFSVKLGVNLTREGLSKSIADFARDVAGSETALFYYAGHGMQIDGVNYLVPIDADISTELDVPFNTQKLNDILDMMMRGSRAALVVLDACRNNPFTRSLRRSMGGRAVAVGDGLATVQLRPGGEALIAYSTQPDNTAEDGIGRNSPFTTALLRFIALQSVSVEEVLKRVGRAVKDATVGHQIPWYNSSLFYNFEFNPGDDRGPTGKADSHEHPWQLLKDSPNPSLIRSFITNFPNDAYVADAKQRLSELESDAWSKIRVEQSLAELDAFLKQYPDGHYATEAKRRLVKLQRFAVGSLSAVGLVTGAFTGFTTAFTGSDFGYFLLAPFLPVATVNNSPIALWLPLGILLFACLVPLGISRWWTQSRKAIVLFIGASILGWLLAHLSYQLMIVGLGAQISDSSLTEFTIPHAATQSLPAIDRMERLALFMVTAMACAIGAAVTFAGAALASARLRHAGIWGLTVFGAALAAGPEIILGAYKFSQLTVLTALFITWQAWVAGCIAWAHIRNDE